MTRDSSKNEETTGVREMLPAAPASEIQPSKFWVLETIFHLIVITTVSVLHLLKDFFFYLTKKKKSVKGKVVVITGSGRGLGRNLALKLARLGAHIVCVDINTANNEETVKLIKQEGGKAMAYTVNVAKSNQVEQFAQDVMKKFGPVDILVNNAALVMGVSLDEMAYDDIRAFYEINAMAPVFLFKAFYPEMRKRNSGHIVAISSVAAFCNVHVLSLYCSTKCALTRFMETMEMEMNDVYPDNQIKTTTIHPFFINTSADYLRFFTTTAPILSEDYVIDETISAILYERSSVCLPHYFKIIQWIQGLIPLHSFSLALKTIARGLNPPTSKDRAELPYSNIVKSTVAESEKSK